MAGLNRSSIGQAIGRLGNIIGVGRNAADVIMHRHGFVPGGFGVVVYL